MKSYKSFGLFWALAVTWPLLAAGTAMRGFAIPGNPVPKPLAAPPDRLIQSLDTQPADC